MTKGRTGRGHRIRKLAPPFAVLTVLTFASATAGATTPTTTTTPTSSTTSPTPTTPAATAPGTGHPVMTPMSGSYVIDLTFDGLDRDYRIHVPPQAASGQPLPLVINMAGATQNGQIEEILSDMDPNADENGYLAVYPDGTRISKVLTPDPVAKQAQYGWNAGECCGLPVTKKINDVGFLEKVIADVAARTPVDLRRVYMTGISNGGMMAYAFAAEASTHVAAIASISGQVEIPVIHPTRPVPTMEFHSVNDPIAKFAGVPNKNPRLVLMTALRSSAHQVPSRLERRPRRSPTHTARTGRRWHCGASPVQDTCGPAAHSTWDPRRTGSSPDRGGGSSSSTRTRRCGTSFPTTSCPPKTCPVADPTLRTQQSGAFHRRRPSFM
jgi:polyhydroxybutyrate depolymerase